MSLSPEFADQDAFAKAVADLNASWQADPYKDEGYDQQTRSLLHRALIAHIVTKVDPILANNLQELQERLTQSVRLSIEMIPETDCFYNPRSPWEIEDDRVTLETDLELARGIIRLFTNRTNPPQPKIEE